MVKFKFGLYCDGDSWLELDSLSSSSKFLNVLRLFKLYMTMSYGDSFIK